MQDYENKKDSYFAGVRREIEPLLPAHAARVLEIGCGAGATLAWLKSRGTFASTTGVEMFESAAAVARTRVDRVIVANAEQWITEPGDIGPFDLVLCLDVLEHMVDPWAFVAQLERLIAPGGHLVCSIPNVRYYKVVRDLLFKGQWRYRHDGILDRTHLRFFTRETALELASTPTLQVTNWRHYWQSRSIGTRLADKLTLGLTRDFLAVQYLTVSRRVNLG
jgi:2-polyprenyl-3-methyl-5-hydroxy-6-metoxy-1,4-benzoquinol methylase